MTQALRPLALVACGVLALAACNRTPTEAEQPAAAPSTAAAPAASDPSTTAKAPAALSVEWVKFGRYVEPKSFAVGGVGTQFKTGDSLFAAVQLQGTAARATLQVRLLDGTGQVVAEQSRSVQPKQAMRVNFALGQAAAAPIQPGIYTAETTLDGQVANTARLTIE